MDQIPFECRHCKVERDHTIRIKELTGTSADITSICTVCGETIKLPLRGVRLRPGQTIEDRVREVLGAGAYKRALRDGKTF